MASEQDKVDHEKILDDNRPYLVDHIDAKGTLLWDNLVQKEVFSNGDAKNIKASPKERRKVLCHIYLLTYV